MANLSLSTFFPTTVVSTSIGKLTYHPGSNMFTTQAYTSQAGNTYFDGIRISEDIVIRIGIGIGYARTFLNSIHIYKADGSAVLLAERHFHCYFYNEYSAKDEAAGMMREALRNAQQQLGHSFADHEIHQLAESLVKRAYERNQLEILNGQTDKLRLLP